MMAIVNVGQEHVCVGQCVHLVSVHIVGVCVAVSVCIQYIYIYIYVFAYI